MRGLAVALSLAWLTGTASAAPALHVVPFPGTPDASPSSHIIFSSLQPAELKSLVVSGTSSGMHPGQLLALPDGAGTAFIPDRAFTPGEQVQVTANLDSPAAGTASGDPGATTLKFSFTVSVRGFPGTPRPLPPRANARESSEPIQSFHSAPELHPPDVTASSDSDSSTGDIFLTPRYSIQEGPMILNSRGQLVWFHPIDGFVHNLEVQHYQGQPVLTWFQEAGGSRANNEDVIMGRAYRATRVLHAAEGYVPDMHEFQLTSTGTALIDAYTLTRQNLTSVGGPANGIVMDCLIQELDVKTGQLLWEWHVLGHIPLSASYLAPPKSSTTPYDLFHLNSIQQLPNGNLLISLRNTWSVYEIDKRTGRIVWTLGGKHSNFRIGKGARFEWQHDAHLQADGLLSIFDDAANGVSQNESESSAKTIRLNLKTNTASLVHRYTHTPPLLSQGEGSTQLLPNHNVFVGWGQSDFTEFSPSGREIFNGTLPLGTTSYRAYRFRWTGQPRTRPSVAVSRQPNGDVRVYVSWNGATQVATWQVRGGSRQSGLHGLASAPRSGFETTIVLHSRPRYLAVQAVNAHGKVIGTTSVRQL